MKFITFLKNNAFILLILAVLIFSVFVPGPGKAIKTVDNITLYLTFVAMFVSGLGLSFSNIKDGFKDWKSIVFSFLSVYLIFPLITVAIMLIIGQQQGDIYIGTMILAAQSSTLASAVVLTASANGNVPLALIITIINNMSAAVLTPVVLKATLSLNESVSFDVGSMIIKLLLALVLPVILAQLLRWFIKEKVNKIAPYRKLVSKAVVLVIVLTGAAAASDRIKENLGIVALVILLVAVLHFVMLALSYLYIRIAKVGHESKSAVLFTSTQKTLPASLLVWETSFSAYGLAPLVLVLHHMTQLLIDSFIAAKLAKRNQRNEGTNQDVKQS